MKWYARSSFKTYLSVSFALVGLSAASTLLTDRISHAQEPTPENTAKIDEEPRRTIKALMEVLGADDPQVKELQKKIDALDQAREAKNQAERAAEEYRRVVVPKDVMLKDGNPLSLIEVDPNGVVTEEIQGNNSIVVRRTADGRVASTAAKEAGAAEVSSDAGFVRGLAYLGRAKQNSELRKAIEKMKDKETSESDKASNKAAIIAILGEQFDNDMEQRGKQIAELEKKVAALKEQIEKRKTARQRLIDLRLELLMNESEGLGFPSSWQQPGAAEGPYATLRAHGAPSATVVQVPYYNAEPPQPPQPPPAPTQPLVPPSIRTK